MMSEELKEYNNLLEEADEKETVDQEDDSQLEEVPIDMIEIEESDIIAFKNIDWSDRKPVILKIRLQEESVKHYNKTGELALLLENVIEQNIVLNKMSLEYASVLYSNVNWYYSSLEAEYIAADLRREGRNRLKKKPVLQEEIAHALDIAAGGNVNMFLNSPRNTWVNRVIGSSWNYAGKIIAGREHLIKVVVQVESEGRNLIFAVEDYLKMKNLDLNTSKLVYGKV